MKNFIQREINHHWNVKTNEKFYSAKYSETLLLTQSFWKTPRHIPTNKLPFKKGRHEIQEIVLSEGIVNL